MPFRNWEIFPLPSENLEQYKISEREQPASYTGKWYVYRNEWVIVAGSDLTAEEKLEWWNLYSKKKIDDYELLEGVAVYDLGMLNLTPFIGIAYGDMGQHVKSQSGMSYEETVNAMGALAPVLEGMVNAPSDPAYDYLGKALILQLTHLERYVDIVLGEGDVVRFGEDLVPVDVFTRAQRYIMENLEEKPGGLDFDTIPELWENNDELVDSLEKMRQDSHRMGLGTLYDFHAFMVSILKDALQIFKPQLDNYGLSVDDVYLLLNTATLHPDGSRTRCCVSGAFFSEENEVSMMTIELAKIERELNDLLPRVEAGDVVSSLLDPTKKLIVEANVGRLVSLSIGERDYPRELIKIESPDVPAGSEAFDYPARTPLPALLTTVSSTHHDISGTVVSYRFNQGRPLVCISPGLPGATGMFLTSTWIDGSLIKIPEPIVVEEVIGEPEPLVPPQPYTGVTRLDNSALAFSVIALFAIVYYLD